MPSQLGTEVKRAPDIVNGTIGTPLCAAICSAPFFRDRGGPRGPLGDIVFDQPLRTRLASLFRACLPSSPDQPRSRRFSPHQAEYAMKWLHVCCRVADHATWGAEPHEGNEARPPALVPRCSIRTTATSRMISTLDLVTVIRNGPAIQVLGNSTGV